MVGGDDSENGSTEEDGASAAGPVEDTPLVDRATPAGPAEDMPVVASPPVAVRSNGDRAPADTRRGPHRRYSPVVQRIAAEHDIDLSQVNGTGRDGRVRKQDVLAFIEAARPSRRCTSRARTGPIRLARLRAVSSRGSGDRSAST